MKVILDTQALLWWLFDDPKLSQRARNAVASPNNVVFVSVVSAWEIGIKQSLGKLAAPNNLKQVIEGYGFSTLLVTFGHAEAVVSLPMHHRDPFDRMLVVQAQTLAVPVVTTDLAFRAYDVKTLW